MRQLITIAALLSFLTAQQVHPKYGMEGVPKKVLAEQRNSESRTEQFELYMADSYGDGWNGASLDLYVNGTLVIDDATVETDYNSIFFDVNNNDIIETVWTMGSWDEECYYGIFDNYGALVAEAGTDQYPELELTHTVIINDVCPFTEFIVTVDGGSYPSEIYWTIENTNYDIVSSGFAPIAVEDDVTVCLPDGSYGIVMTDTYGDGWNGNVIQLWTLDADGNPVEYLAATLETGAYGVVQLDVGDGPFDDLLGCTDPIASNTDSDALWDDGSCTYEGTECSTALTATIGTNETTGAPRWYTFTSSTSGLATVSSDGSGVDTQVYGYSGTCEDLTQVGFGDDEGADYSSIMSFAVEEGVAYYIHWTDYWSSAGFSWTLEVEGIATTPTDLMATSGLDQVYLNWNPFDPALLEGRVESNISSEIAQMNVEEHVQHRNDKIENSKVDNPNAWQGKTLEELQDHVATLDLPQHRDTDVYITLYDSYGDGHNADAFVLRVDDDGYYDFIIDEVPYDAVEIMSGGWSGYESAYGPFTLADGLYYVWWNPDGATYLGEQSFVATDADGNQLGSGEYGVGAVNCFEVGTSDVDCPAVAMADLTYPDADNDGVVDGATYDAMTGRFTIPTVNIGSAPSASFYTMVHTEYPDTLNLYPSTYFQYEYTGPGLDAGESSDIYMQFYLTVPDVAGGYDDMDWTFYVWVDSWGNLVAEPGGNTNNVMALPTITNTSPFSESSWNIYRGVDGGAASLLTNVTAPDWTPSSGPITHLDETALAGSDYCYTVTQVNSTVESGASNEACASSIATPDVPAPSNLTGYAAGFDINLSWDEPEPYGTTNNMWGVGTGNSSRTRQGGENIDDATVITDLSELLSGNNIGYVDDYDENCDAGTSTSGDVVYSFTPSVDMAANFSACYSDYDTKLFIYENEAGVLAMTNSGQPACNDDYYYGDNLGDCTQWSSFLEGVYMEAGNTYYIVIDGWSGNEGNYQIEITPYDPLVGYTIYQDGFPIGSSGSNEWSTVLFTGLTTELSYTVTANYQLLGIVDMVESAEAGPHVVTIELDDSPVALQAETYTNNVALFWEEPVLSENLELSYDDGNMTDAWYYPGATAVRFRVNGSYEVNAIANAIWMGNWPDGTYGQAPFKLSLFNVDPETGNPGQAITSSWVTVDANPESDNYGWGMVEFDTPVSIEGDVFAVYSDFGYNYSTGSYADDMDIMGCDGGSDYPENQYYIEADPFENGSSILWSQYSPCPGDWMMRLNVNFTAGDGATFSNWIGSETLASSTINNENFRQANSKENPAQLAESIIKNPTWTDNSASRDLEGYNIYRDGTFLDNSGYNTEYFDFNLDWGNYSYYVTALYGEDESNPSNTVNVELVNNLPVAGDLIYPDDNTEITVDELGFNNEIDFAATEGSDEDYDQIEYVFEAIAISGEDTSYITSYYNSLENGSFDDEYISMDNGWQKHAVGWETYPDADHYTVIEDGENVYNSESVYTTYDGGYAAKMWGRGDGNENNLFQSYYRSIPPGSQFWADAVFYQATDDPVGEDASVVLFAKYFDDNWGWYGMNTSEPFTASDPMDEWQYRGVWCTVPEGATMVQVGIMYSGGPGAVAIDDVYLHLPVLDPEFTVDYGTFAQFGLDLGLENVTYSWDIWTGDGFDYVPSPNGPRNLIVNLDVDYPVVTLDPAEIAFGTVANGDLLTSQFTVSNTGEGMLEFDLDLVNGFNERGRNGYPRGDRSKIGMNANEMQPSLLSLNDRLEGSMENNFSNNTSSRDGHQLALLDSNFTGANCVTGTELIDSVLYQVNYCNNTIEKFDLKYDEEHQGHGEPMTHDFTISIGGGSYPDEVRFKILQIALNDEGIVDTLGVVYPVSGGDDWGYAGTESNGLTLTLNDGNYSIRMADTYGDGWNGNVFSLLLPDGEVYWQTTMENFGFSQFNVYPEEYDMVFNVGHTQRAVLANQNMLISMLQMDQSYGMTFDGQNLWVGAYQDGAGFGVNGFSIDNYGGNVEFVGGFNAPMMGDQESYYPTLAYDGYALLVRSAFDAGSPLKAVDFDGSELFSWEISEETNADGSFGFGTVSMVYVPGYGENWYGWGSLMTHRQVWDDDAGYYTSFSVHELIPSSDENGVARISLSNEGLHTGIGVDYGRRLEMVGSVYDAMALDGVGNLHIKQWYAYDKLYSYDLMETAPQPIFSEISGLLSPGESSTIDFNIVADRPNGNFNIMVYSNDPENYDAHIPVTYDVAPPTITVDPASILDVALQTGEESEHMVTIGNTGGFDLEYGVDIVLNDEMGRTTTIDVVTRKGAANMAMRSPIEGRSGGATQTSFEIQSISNNNHVNSYMNHPGFSTSSLTRDGHLFMVFDGMELNPEYEIFTWGGNEIFVEEGAGMDYGDGPSNALTYIQGDVWTGGGFFMQEDLSHLWENNGQIGFALDSEPNMPTLRLQFESGDARLGYNFTPNPEGGWHYYTFALNDFVYFDGTSDFDPSNVNVFQVLSEGNGEPGRVYRFDYLVAWEGMQSEPWITQVGGDQFGMVEFGAEPDELFFMLRADNLSSGMHYGDIVINSNDPNNPSVMIPVSVNVTALPIFGFNGNNDFGVVQLGGTRTEIMTIYNEGMEVLEISNVDFSSDNDGFTTNMTPVSIDAGGMYEFEVTFAPLEERDYMGGVTFSTNDPNVSTFSVDLYGTGFAGPEIELSHEALSVNLVSYETDTVLFAVQNNGPQPLEYSMHILPQEAPTETVLFVKPDYADPYDAQNQDRINDTTWIARGDNQGLFNAWNQDGYDGCGPENTMWKWGPVEFDNEGQVDWTTGWDGCWVQAVENSGYTVNQALVQQVAGTPVMGLAVYSGDNGQHTYYNITWLSFTGGNSGGGFSYERTEVRPDNDMMVPDWVTINNVDGSSLGAGEGETVPFIRTSSNGDDWYFEENQDRIKPDIWITRHDQYPLFNAYNQSPYQGSSPSGTAWARGYMNDEGVPVDQYGNEDINWYGGDYGMANMFWESFNMGIGSSINEILIPEDESVLMLLEGYDEVFEIKFIFWEQGCCGGFGYTRTSSGPSGEEVHVVDPGQIRFYKMGFNAGNMLEGLYNAEMMINSNDLLNPEIMVNISMDVTGFAELHVDQSALDFGELYLGESSHQAVHMHNSGTSVLVIDAEVDNTDYTLGNNNFEIHPGENAVLDVHFEPSQPGESSGRITLNSNDENSPFVIDIMGMASSPPIIAVSTDSIGVYVPEQEVRTRTFEITNSGGSDLVWSVGGPSSNDMRHSIGGLEEYRDQWVNSMVVAESYSQDRTFGDSRSRTISSPQRSNRGPKSAEMSLPKNRINGSRESQNNRTRGTVNSSRQSVGDLSSNITQPLLPPVAHTSRDGHTKILILPTWDEWETISTLDALSRYYGNYDVHVIGGDLYSAIGPGDLNLMSLRDSIIHHMPDVILIGEGSYLPSYMDWGMIENDQDQAIQWNLVENMFMEIAANYGVSIVQTAAWSTLGLGNPWSNQNQYYFDCCGFTIPSGPNSYDPNHPLMMGVGDEYDFDEGKRYHLGPNSGYNTVLDVSEEFELHPDSSGSMIIHQQVGSGHLTAIGHPGWNWWTDDMSMVLANAVQLGGNVATFEPSGGVVSAGSSVSVLVEFNAEEMQKGEYSGEIGIRSNDIYNPVVDMMLNMRVTGTPGMRLLTEGPGMFMNENELSFGQVHFLDTNHVEVMIMNFDSSRLDVSLSLENSEYDIFQIHEGATLDLDPFEEGLVRLSAHAGLDEMTVLGGMIMETANPDIPTHTMSLHAHLVPRFESIITGISDVYPDQGGWVTVEFTRSYFDGWFGDFQRTDIYTVEILHDGEWTAANSTVGYESHRYHTLVHTTQDSGSMGDGLTAFRVVAGMDEGTYISEESLGYSTDDMAPAAPTGLLASQTGSDITLAWDAPEIEDFNYFSIHRSETENFDVDESNLIGHTTELAFIDTGATWFTTLYYRLTATDFAGNNGDASDAVEGYVHVNFAPTLSEVDPQSMDEDGTYELVLSASDQNEGDILTFTATSSSSEAVVSVSNDTLTVELTPNWFGVTDIEVHVTDGELSDTTSFELTINSVNDAPEVFGLISPPDSSVIAITPQDIAENSTLMISWEESSDIDGDDLNYGFALYNGAYGPDAVAIVDTTLSETMIQVPYENIAQLIVSLGETYISGDWTVFTTDGVDTTMSDHVWHITLDASGLLSIDGQMLPEEFALHQNYPNPFNPTTAIRYDLPESGEVSIMIYDIMGREIRSLVSGHQDAGFRIVNWDATNDYGQAISAGMYIYVIQAGDFRMTKKMVLLK